jgi:DNA invertase Pin-like site-specific DNA recombinase
MPAYAIYARKSSESEDRQILSIDAQFEELRTLAHRRGLEVVDCFSESRSAKAPGRPVFSQLLKLVAKEQITGILSWKLDRLARNPIDGAALIWAMELGQLREIVTPQRAFAGSSDDKFLMQLEFGIAKKYVDDLSENVKRGNRAKLRLGWLPGPAPLGYLNDRVNRTIVPDPERFELVRQLWQLVLAGRPIPEILETAHKEWGLRTLKRTRTGGTPLSRSHIYYLLSNPFYYGLISRGGQTNPGAHQPMISKEEYDRVQQTLGRDVRPPYRRQTFAYTGLMTCAECGFAITAERHEKKGQNYVYYRCSKRHPELRCTQRYVPEAQVDNQFADLLDRLTIPDRALEWLTRRLEHLHETDQTLGATRKDLLAKGLTESQTRIGRLLDLRIGGQISEAEFLAKRQDLVNEQVEIRGQLEKAEDAPNRAFETTKKALSFGKRVRIRFLAGSPVEKRTILFCVGSNYRLGDKTVLTSVKKPFDLLVNRSENPNWWAILDAVRTFFLQHPDAITWPEFLFPPDKKARNSPNTFTKF